MKNVDTIWSIIENIFKFIVYKVMRLKLSEKAWDSAIQFVKFGIVGLSNTAIGYLAYTVSLKGLRVVNAFPKIDIYISQLIMFLLSVLWSFYWNNKVVFRVGDEEHRNIFVALIKTYISYVFTSLLLSEAFLLLWVAVLGVSEYIAPMINLIITVPLNFLIQKFWSFRIKSNNPKE